MKRTTYIAVLLVSGLLSAPAWSFSETTVGQGSSSSAQPAPAAPAQPNVQLANPDAGSKDQKGVEVRIPGLGKLGVLPRLDLGLEILYGASNDKQRDEAQQGTPGHQEDVTVHGSFKHRF